MSRRARAALFGALALAVLVFIFSNSLRDAGESSEQSGRIAALLRALVDPAHRIPEETFPSAVRKLAHFTEFAAFGLFACLCAANLLRRGRTAALLPAVCAAAAAVTDELLQRLSPGRSCSVRDMLLDTCGALCGIALAMLLTRKQRKKV